MTKTQLVTLGSSTHPPYPTPSSVHLSHSGAERKHNMKRKKWSELEEQTLLTKYSELANSGSLSKLKTREKKFKPIAEHVNSLHHLHDPVTYPFKWSWRDVSIKVQNMRHQYLGVKQKIRLSNDEFNWNDGENHWENFLKYKEVFGDVELDPKGKKVGGSGGGGDLYSGFGDSPDLGLGLDDLDDDDEYDEEEEEEEDEGDDGGGNGGGDTDCDPNGVEEELDDIGDERENGNLGVVRLRKPKRGFGSSSSRRLRMLGRQVLELRDVMVRREEKRREREFGREKGLDARGDKWRESDLRREMRLSKGVERVENRELDLEERELVWVRWEFEKRMRVEREFDEERMRRMRMEEKREEEEMEWREKMIDMQIEHEKAMMRMQADACHNQMQVLGAMARLFCQFFGSTTDALGGGLGVLTPQMLQNLQHPGGLDDTGKPDVNSPSEFI